MIITCNCKCFVYNSHQFTSVNKFYHWRSSLSSSLDLLRVDCCINLQSYSIVIVRAADRALAMRTLLSQRRLRSRSVCWRCHHRLPHLLYLLPREHHHHQLHEHAEHYYDHQLAPVVALRLPHQQRCVRQRRMRSRLMETAELIASLRRRLVPALILLAEV